MEIQQSGLRFSLDANIAAAMDLMRLSARHRRNIDEESLASLVIGQFEHSIEKIVAHGVNAMRQADRSFLLVTHYQRLLNYVVPDVVHVLLDGRIIRSGGKELALELEEKGYSWLEKEPAGAR